MIGALDIINEKGIALSFDQVGISAGKSDMPIFIKMREIAETCSTFAEAKKEILAIPIGVPFCIGLSDSKTGESAVFEREGSSEIKFRLSNNGILTADNSIWCGRNMTQCAVDSVAHKIKPQTANDVKTILRDQSVLLECNIYSVIFDFPNNKFYIAAGNLPAAKSTYNEYPLFKKTTNH
jgi:predicted choloylglycine hydrolase